MSERRRRVFPETFGREAVERAATSGLPIARVARELGLNETGPWRWIARFGAEGTAPQRRPERQAAAPSRAGLAAAKARLKRALQRAEMERDILEKAALIFRAAFR